MPIAKYAETQRHWVENNPEYYINYRKTEEHKLQAHLRTQKSRRFHKEKIIFLRILLD